MTVLAFLFIENDIMTNETNFLIYDLSMHFIIVNKNCFFRSIIRNIMINQYIYSIFFMLLIINNMLIFNFLDLLFNIICVIVDSSQYNHVNFDFFLLFF